MKNNYIGITWLKDWELHERIWLLIQFSNQFIFLIEQAIIFFNLFWNIRHSMPFNWWAVIYLKQKAIWLEFQHFYVDFLLLHSNYQYSFYIFSHSHIYPCGVLLFYLQKIILLKRQDHFPLFSKGIVVTQSWFC